MLYTYSKAFYSCISKKNVPHIPANNLFFTYRMNFIDKLVKFVFYSGVLYLVFIKSGVLAYIFGI